MSDIEVMVANLFSTYKGILISTNQYHINASIGTDSVILVYACCPCIIFNRGSLLSQKAHPNCSVIEQHVQRSTWLDKSISNVELKQGQSDWHVERI